MTFSSHRRSLSAAVALTMTTLASGCGAASNTPTTTHETAPKTPIAQAAEIIPSTLDDYIARPEPAFKWTPESSAPNQWDLRLTSLQWHGTTWTHKIQIFEPEKNEFPGTALLLISYGHGTPQEAFFGQLISNAMGATFVNFFDVPNQPLFGAREDDLIAYTFDQYLQGGDSDWPLLLPMTKSAVKAMDAVQDWSKQRGHPITKFMVGGGSKRGWTTWLTAAVDARVKGIVPMVYDNLHLEKQLPHQVASWGGYSDRVAAYTKLHIQARFNTPRGRALAAIVDPWTYRARVTVPKLIVNAANDEYWTLDSYNLYRHDLKGQTNVFYVPNAGHILNGAEMNTFGTIAAWFRTVAANKPIPQVGLEEALAVERSAPGFHYFNLTIKGKGGAGAKRRLWIARAQTRDFRKSKWTAIEVNANESGVAVGVPPAPQGQKFTAVFGEIEIAGEPAPLRLSSPIKIYEADLTETPPAPAHP